MGQATRPDCHGSGLGSAAVSASGSVHHVRPTAMDLSSCKNVSVRETYMCANYVNRDRPRQSRSCTRKGPRGGCEIRAFLLTRRNGTWQRQVRRTTGSHNGHCMAARITKKDNGFVGEQRAIICKRSTRWGS